MNFPCRTLALCSTALVCCGFIFTQFQEFFSFPPGFFNDPFIVQQQAARRSIPPSLCRSCSFPCWLLILFHCDQIEYRKTFQFVNICLLFYNVAVFWETSRDCWEQRDSAMFVWMFCRCLLRIFDLWYCLAPMFLSLSVCLVCVHCIFLRVGSGRRLPCILLSSVFAFDPGALGLWNWVRWCLMHKCLEIWYLLSEPFHYSLCSGFISFCCL